ncbi:MAG: ATP-dependent DNA helicase, partial [Rhodospirillales bacterium]|nr:ATP-dependent DNA helicase [Rhodospirillales bacterium]
MSEPPSPPANESRPTALVVGLRSAAWINPEGEVEILGFDEAKKRLRHAPPPLLCHGAATRRRLKAGYFPALDVLELFAFVHPARFCVPTPRGLSAALGLAIPETAEDEAAALYAITGALLRDLANADPLHLGRDLHAVAWAMAQASWPWGGSVLKAIGGGEAPHSRNLLHGLRVWHRLPEWEEQAPKPAPGHQPVDEADTRARLDDL